MQSLKFLEQDKNVKKMLHSSFVLAVTWICMFCVSLIYKVTFDDIEYKNNQKNKPLSIILGDLEIEPIAQTFSKTIQLMKFILDVTKN